MALTLASAARLLSEYGLLREIIQGDAWTLDSRLMIVVLPHTLRKTTSPQQQRPLDSL